MARSCPCVTRHLLGRLGIDDFLAIRAVTVRERFLNAQQHRFLWGATLKKRNLRETLHYNGRPIGIVCWVSEVHA